MAVIIGELVLCRSLRFFAVHFWISGGHVSPKTGVNLALKLENHPLSREQKDHRLWDWDPFVAKHHGDQPGHHPVSVGKTIIHPHVITMVMGCKNHESTCL